MTESGEARKHRAQPVEQGKNDPNVGIRSQVQQLNCFQRRGRFGGLATGTAEPGQAVGPGATGSLRYAQEGSEERPPELVREGGVTWLNSSRVCVTCLESLASHGEGVEPMVIEGRHAPLFARTLPQVASRHAGRARSRWPPSNTNTNTDTDSLTLSLAL